MECYHRGCSSNLNLVKNKANYFIIILESDIFSLMLSILTDTQQAIVETIRMRLDTIQALEYLHDLGVSISRATYFRQKNFDLPLGCLSLDAVPFHDLADELVVGGDVGEVLF